MPEWPSYVNFRKVTQNPHFQKKCKKETKRSFSNIAQKEALASMGNSTLAQMSLSSKLYLLITQRLQKILAQKAAPKLPEWLSYANSRKVTQNPHFLKKVQRGDQGKFLKNLPKSSPRLKGPKALWRKWHYPVISMDLNWKDWRRFRRKQRLQKCPNGQVIDIFRKVTQNPHFLKKCKGGTKGNFSKIAQTVALVWKAQKHSGANGIIL